MQALQERLRELGYDPGPADGVYGHQTAEAVRELQRDCRLRVDGIAGPQVLSVLRDPAVLALRRPLALAPGQSLADAARALQLSPAALRRALGLPPRAQPAPGQRWVLWERVVAAEVKPGPGQAAGLRALQRRASLVSAAAVFDVVEGVVLWNRFAPPLPIGTGTCPDTSVAVVGVVLRADEEKVTVVDAQADHAVTAHPNGESRLSNHFPGNRDVFFRTLHHEGRMASVHVSIYRQNR
ncbi:MAG: peptidoglycan-binding protein [Limnochordales bacterium]